MDAAAVEWKSGIHPTLRVFDKLVNFWWTCNVSTYRNIFFSYWESIGTSLFQMVCFLCIPSSVLASSSSSFFSDDSHSKNTCLHLLSLPRLLHFLFSIFSRLPVWFTWVFPHSSINLGLWRAFLRGHLWVSLSRSVLSAYKYNLVCLCHYQITSPPPQIRHRTCLLPLCWLSAFLIIAVLIKFSAASTES